MIMAAVMIISTLLSCHIKLSRRISDIEYYFYNGTYDEGMGIQYDLSKINDAISGTISLADKYGIKTDAIASLPREYQTCKSVNDYAAWYKKVNFTYPTYLRDMSNEQITRERDKGYIQSFEYDYKSAVKTIKMSEYHSKLAKYKQDTGNGFAAIIKKLSFTKEVASFA